VKDTVAKQSKKWLLLDFRRSLDLNFSLKGFWNCLSWQGSLVDVQISSSKKYSLCLTFVEPCMAEECQHCWKIVC